MLFTVTELLASMDRDLAESSGTWYGGYDELVGWLNESFDYHMNIVKEDDPDGRYVGDSATADYTADAVTMPLTTWVDPAPSDILEVGLATSGEQSTKLDFIDYHRRRWWEEHHTNQMAWFLRGDDIGLVPAPGSDTSLELSYFKSGYKLYKPGTLDPLPPGGGTWATHKPAWFDGHYPLLAAYAVVLAAISEGLPPRDFQARHRNLEDSFRRYLSRRRQRQDRDRIEVANPNDFACYGG